MSVLNFKVRTGESRKYLRFAQKLSEVSLAVGDGILRCKSVKRSVCSFPSVQNQQQKKHTDDVGVFFYW